MNKKTANRELKRGLKLVRSTIRVLNADQLDEVNGASSTVPVGGPPRTDGGCSFTRLGSSVEF